MNERGTMVSERRGREKSRKKLKEIKDFSNAQRHQRLWRCIFDERTL